MFVLAVCFVLFGIAFSFCQLHQSYQVFQEENNKTAQSLFLIPAMDKLRNGLQILKEHILEKPDKRVDYPSCQFETEKHWLDLRFHSNNQVIKPHELENEITDPPGSIDERILEKIQGSLIGLALGDALGAHVEFQPHTYLLENPVTDMQGGGASRLRKGQFTDNTSMALCLANSLVGRHGFVPYDQLVRYKWWYQYGYMSSKGKCFNIGSATKKSLDEFIRRQEKFAKKQKIYVDRLDYLSDRQLLEEFPVDCSTPSAAGSGALMRLAPVPLFFREHPEEAIELSGYSGQITHGDIKAYDACRYFAALIFATLHNYTKEQLLDKNFYEKNKLWFGFTPLCNEIRTIAEGSYQKQGGYDDGIRGQGYIVRALEAALWAFWSDEDSFEKGVLAAVNLGDDTDTIAAIYGQLAGAYYGYKNLPKKWVNQVYAKKYILQLTKWIAYEGKTWKETEIILSSDKALIDSISLKSPEQCFSSESLVSYLAPRWKGVSGTFPSRKTSRISSTNDIPDQYAVSFSPYENTDGLVTFRNSHSNEQQSANRISAPELHREESFSNDFIPSGTNCNSEETSMLTSTSIDQSSIVSNEKNETSVGVPAALESMCDTLDGTNAPPLQVFESLPKAPDLNHCMDWSCDEVCNWIRSLGTIYETYISAFQKHHINGLRLLNFVDNDALLEFGVTSSHNRRVIMYSIKQLKAKHATALDSVHSSNFYDDFSGDFIPRLYLTDSIYPNTKSCILNPLQDDTHFVLYDQILKWLGPLPSDIDIDKIELVHNPESNRMFLQQINRTERKQMQKAFQSRLEIESNLAERIKVLERLQTLIRQVNHNRDAPVVRVWHGCRRDAVSQLVANGFAALGKLDNGWFGKAMYFTSSAEYAVKYTNSTGCLIMCYVVLLNPFPVITDDAPPAVPIRNFRFYGAGNYSNYQCHYIPVAPMSRDTPSNFRPPPDGVQAAHFDEFAIFQQADILPQVIVHLKPRTTSLLPSSTSAIRDDDSRTVFLAKE